MAEPTSDKHYVEKFEFPLWKLIKQRAEEKDICYSEAVPEVVSEYVKTIKYRDPQYEDKEILKRAKEMIELGELEQKLGIQYKDIDNKAGKK